MTITDPNLEPETEPEGIRNLREANERLKAEADAGKAAQRELALVRAGVDTESPAGKMFAKAFDGDLSDLDAVKAAWSEVAPATAPAATIPPAPTESSLRRDLAGGEGLDPQLLQTGDKEPTLVDAFETFEELVRKRGEAPEDAAEAVFGFMIDQATKGNPDFTWNDEAIANHNEAAKRFGS